jgi:hypothetical protein
MLRSTCATRQSSYITNPVDWGVEVILGIAGEGNSFKAACGAPNSPRAS